MATGGVWIVEQKDLDENGRPKPGAVRKPGVRGDVKPLQPKPKRTAGGE